MKGKKKKKVRAKIEGNDINTRAANTKKEKNSRQIVKKHQKINK